MQHLEKRIEQLLIEALLALGAAKLLIIFAFEELPDPRPCLGRIVGSQLDR